MQTFKIDNFLRENPGAIPPQFTPLAEHQVRQLVNRLLLRVGSPQGSPEQIIRSLLERSFPIEGVNLDHDQIDLAQLFTKCGIVPGPVLYLEWGPLREIDCFQMKDLNKHFYDVWYPSSDDIELFDDTLDWIIFVRHYGGVQLLALNQRH